MSRWSSAKNIGLLFLGIFSLVVFIVFCIQFQGNLFPYFIYSFSFFMLLYLSLKKGFLFFEFVLGALLYLGHWAKVSIRHGFFNGEFHEPTGYFSHSVESYDNLFYYSSLAIFGVIFAMIIRRLFFPKYSNLNELNPFKEWSEIYSKNRKVILILFITISILIAYLNFNFGIYQRGLISTFKTSFLFKGLFTWLILFGGASFSALFLETEIRTRKTVSWTLYFAVLAEGFFSNASMLSRSMIINIGSLALGVIILLEKEKYKIGKARILSTILLFFIVFFLSIVFVKGIRNEMHHNRKFNTKEVVKSFDGKKPQLVSSKGILTRLRNAVVQSRSLLIDRWVGLEGMMAVIGYNKKGWGLWRKAWGEKFTGQGTSFFDLEIFNSVYKNQNLEGVHFVSMPGIMGFLFYPGSLIFLFVGMFFVTFFGIAFELLCYKLSGLTIATALFSQTLAYRFIHFGYVPSRTYLILTTLFLNIVLLKMIFSVSASLSNGFFSKRGRNEF